MSVQERPTDDNRVISPEMRQILAEEIIESEIDAAMDAAAEEGIVITREAAIEMLNKSQND